ncbi:MAG: UDP-N-acetylglucosamine 1-carboxyvinyltransferase [Lachnospiraceae bacterium]|nr:UDP-N-acetylglucosamine 1-carboxyvinyltransferase [Lachnospiraceae bacterium]
MSAIQVQGLRPLSGKIEIQGSKNAVLPMMAAALLAKSTTVLHRVPAIADVDSMTGILESLGCVCSFSDGSMTIDATAVSGTRIPECYVGKMRSSVMVLGPLLARLGEAATSFPGGCVLGKRPIDLHLYALQELGASIQEAGGMILAEAKKLSGANLVLRFASVGATENAVLAAVTAEGITVLEHAAREPEIVELCAFLSAMGAKISGAGTETIRIEGVQRLHACEWTLGADRICAGTYLAAALAAGGDIAVCGADPRSLKAPLLLMEAMGARIRADEREREIRLTMRGRPKGFSAATGPYPAFPTDLQSVFLAAACTADGESRITETVFEARFAAARILRDFGAQIWLSGQTAVIRGSYPLKPAIVRAPDLRGGAALLAAALAADGVSMIDGAGHIERGYEDICRDLRTLGAEVFTIHS